jgi:hypothetical protein
MNRDDAFQISAFTKKGKNGPGAPVFISTGTVAESDPVFPA